MTAWRTIGGVCVMAMLGSSCAGPASPPPTASRPAPARSDAPANLPPRTVILYHLQRVLDPNLPTDRRIDALKLLAQLGEDLPEVREALAEMLAQGQVPDELRRQAQAMLQRNGERVAQLDATGPDEPAASNLRDDPDARQATLDWIARRPRPDALPEVVKLWALEPSPDTPREGRYRDVVETITAKAWDQALLDGLNSKEFFTRGAAMEILTRRLAQAQLRARILALSDPNETVQALAAFIREFDYLPATAKELAATVAIHQGSKPLLQPAAKLFRQWAQTYDYPFNIRDFHLLSRLGGEPSAPGKLMSRPDLIRALNAALESRSHARYAAAAEAPGVTDRFVAQVETGKLTLADLWNLHLLSEMLSRPRVQSAIAIMAQRDRMDTTSAWGGLVFYADGQADARLYPPAEGPDGDDRVYRLAPRTQQDARDALCLLVAHFEKAANAPRAGPTADELAQARQLNLYGLTLTSLDETSFAAHYYNPQGRVVSLGVFPLRQ